MAHAMLSIAVLSLTSANETGGVIEAAPIVCSKILETTYLETTRFSPLGSDPISVEVMCVNKSEL